MPAPGPAPAVVQRVVTLVYGTWVPTAAWTNPNSALWSALIARFGDAVVIARVPWGGWNRVQTRWAGAQKLAAHLRELLARYPEAKHYLVGHSHGGTVAMMALADPALAARVHGIACLATPFLHVRRRIVMNNALGISLLFTLAFALVWERTLGRVLRTQYHTVYENSYGHAALMIACAAPVVPLLWFGLRRWYRRAETVRARSALPALPADRVLLLRADSDEASSLLAAMALIGSVPGRLWSWAGLAATRGADRHGLHRPLNGSRTLRRILVRCAVGAAAAAGAGVVAGLGWIDRSQLRGVSSAMTFLSMAAAVEVVIPVGLLAAYAMHAVLGFVAVALALWWAVTLLGFGWEIATVGPFLDPSAEATPPGTWELHHFSSPEPELRVELNKNVVLLKHSEIYNNPAAIQRLVEWIGSK